MATESRPPFPPFTLESKYLIGYDLSPFALFPLASGALRQALLPRPEDIPPKWGKFADTYFSGPAESKGGTGCLEHQKPRGCSVRIHS